MRLIGPAVVCVMAACSVESGPQGEPGPHGVDGEPGVPGERGMPGVPGTFGVVRIETESITTPIEDPPDTLQFEIVASCDDEETLVGGGCSSGEQGYADPTASHPVVEVADPTPRQWRCRWVAGTVGVTLTAYALCAE